MQRSKVHSKQKSPKVYCLNNAPCLIPRRKDAVKTPIDGGHKADMSRVVQEVRPSIRGNPWMESGLDGSCSRMLLSNAWNESRGLGLLQALDTPISRFEASISTMAAFALYCMRHDEYISCICFPDPIQSILAPLASMAASELRLKDAQVLHGGDTEYWHSHIWVPSCRGSVGDWTALVF